MLEWIRLLLPPEWTVWSLVQKATYIAVFFGAIFALRWALNGVWFLVFGY